MGETHSHSHSHSQLGAFEIRELEVSAGSTRLVTNVSLKVAPGSIHCLVGDSGSGKTLTSLASIGLLPAGVFARGEIRLGAVDGNLLELDDHAWSAVRGKEIGYVGQNALGCLHPAYSIEFQLVEAIRRHQRLSRSAARALALTQLAEVDLAEPERVAKSVPTQLSGGMCQRVALAIALCNRPAILIADEPTTALDSETQEHILRLIEKRTETDGLGVLLITHDQDVVRRIGDETTVIRDGVSSGTQSLSSQSAGSPDPSTNAARRSAGSRSGADGATLEVTGVGKRYRGGRSKRDRTEAVLNNVSISAHRGMTIGLVGRSGAGKTTLARIVAGILEPTTGEVVIDGRPLVGPQRVKRHEKARLVQYVFQDPYGSLNPRRAVVAQVADPLVAGGAERADASEQARSLLLDVGLSDDQIDRRPRQLSGGQCQRVGIARALITRPKVVVLDEPVSALDWSIRSEILDILDDLQAQTDAAYLLIAHERPLIEKQCDEIYEVCDGAVQRL